GMYIGRIGNGSHPDDGCYILLKEVLDNAVDEYIMGFGKEVQIYIEGNRVAVRDFGRGIPLGKVVDCVSKINTGAKYNDEVFQFSVGLNGVGTKAVNALSDVFVVRSHRGGEFVEASFKPEHLERRLRHYSYLNTGLRLILKMGSGTGVPPVRAKGNQTRLHLRGR